jgi:hypothetical protein
VVSGERMSNQKPKAIIDQLVFFSWWHQCQQRVQDWQPRSRGVLLGMCIAVGVVLRLWAQTLPGNWDFNQWVNVSSAALNGEDPYSQFGYNYPPPWLLLTAGLQALADDSDSFRLLISLVLCAADIGIALILAKRGYTLAACLYILSPIAIAISGQHQQVESIALVFAFAAALLLSGRSNAPLRGIDWWAAILLGVSLAFKPVFLLFPLWLLLRSGPLRRRLMLFFVSCAVLGLSVLSAFIAYPPAEVVARIFGHQGTDNAPFINAFVPSQLAPWVVDAGGPKIAFIVILIAAAFLFRKLDVFEMALAYTITAVLFSWAVANQYLLTPMAGVAVYLNIGFFVWLMLSTIYLGGAPDILNLWGLKAIQQHVMLEWTRVFQDLFPWFFAGWILMLVAVRRLPQPSINHLKEGD